MVLETDRGHHVITSISQFNFFCCPHLLNEMHGNITNIMRTDLCLQLRTCLLIQNKNILIYCLISNLELKINLHNMFA